MGMLGRPAARAPLSTADITDGIITSAKIAADVLTAADIAPNAVTNSEMADDAVGIAELSATGTAGTTTFLRGDNTWTVVDTEGTGIKSTGESGGDKFLREDGDGTSSWQVAGSPSIDDGGNATAMTIDSAEDVTFAKRAIIPSLKPASNQNLTGTYSDHEMIIGDQFTLTGDLTINDNLVLASLSGSGQDITITDDGNGRTITTAGRVLSCTTTNTDATVTTASTADLRAGKGVTGTGVPAGATIASVTNATTFELSAAATASGTVNLTFDTGIFEAGEFLGTVPLQTDIGDMTSGVMSPNLDLGSATFPSGHIIGLLGKAQDRTRRQFTSRVANTWYDDYTYLNLTVTPKYASSLLWFVGQVSYGVSTLHGSTYMTFLKDGDATNTLNGDDTQTSGNFPCFHQRRWDMGSAGTTVYHMEQASINGYIMAGSTNTQSFTIRYRNQGATNISFNKDGYNTPGSSPGSHSPSGLSTLQIYEVRQ
jgi:hypothetical protein